MDQTVSLSWIFNIPSDFERTMHCLCWHLTWQQVRRIT